MEPFENALRFAQETEQIEEAIIVLKRLPQDFRRRPRLANNPETEAHSPMSDILNPVHDSHDDLIRYIQGRLAPERCIYRGIAIQ